MSVVFRALVICFAALVLAACQDDGSTPLPDNVSSDIQDLRQHYSEIDQLRDKDKFGSVYREWRQILLDLKNAEYHWSSPEEIESHLTVTERLLDFYILEYGSSPFSASLKDYLDSERKRLLDGTVRISTRTNHGPPGCTYDCDSDPNIEVPPSCTGSDCGDDDDDNCDSSCRAESTEDDINGQAEGDDEEVTGDVGDATDATGEDLDQTSDQQQQADQEEEKNQEAAAATDSTRCPVCLSDGSKITQSMDWESRLIEFSRKHRVAYQSAWSLGAGWHWNLDSRLIWGTGLLLEERISILESRVAALQVVIADIESRKPYYENYLSHSFEIVRNAAHDGLDMLEARQAEVEAALNEVNAVLQPLKQQYETSQLHAQRNQFVTDPSHRAEEQIGVDILKWVSPTGDRVLFKKTGNTYSPVGVNGYSLGEWFGGKAILGPEGVEYHFNQHGLLIAILDGSGGRVDLDRNSDQHITRIRDNLGSEYDVGYNGDRLTTITDPAGRTMTFSYDDQARLTRVERFDGSSEEYRYEYNPEPLAITRKIDGEGHARVYDYRQQDGNTVVDRQTDPAGYDWEYDYDFAANRTVVHQRSAPETGHRVEYLYGEDNRTRKKTELPSGAAIQYEYDARGNRTQIIDELGRSTSLTYDGRGNVTEQIDPEGRATTFERDAQGRLIRQIDNAGQVTEFIRDAEGQVTEIRLPTGAHIQQFWENHRLKRRIDEEGHVTRWFYDENGYPSRIEYQDAVTGELTEEHYQYDAVGRVLEVEDEVGRLTTYRYSDPDTGRSLNQPTRITDPTGRTAEFRYNGNNDLVYSRDFSGVVIHLTYTSRGQVEIRTIEMPQPDGNGVEHYTYHYEYDAENRLVRAEHPGGIVWAYEYDTRDNLVRSEMVGTDIVQTFDYDAAGQLIGEQDTTGGEFDYDYFADGQLQRVIDPLGNLRDFEYDAQGRLHRINDQGIGGQVLEYQRDALGQVTAVTDARYHTRYYALNQRGERTGVSLPDTQSQMRQTQTLNRRGQVLSQADITGGEITYEYNAAGELIRMTDSEGGVTTYAYDNLGRKIFEHSPAGLETSWQYVQTDHYVEIRRTRIDPTLSVVRLDRERMDIERYDLMGRLILSEDAAGQQWHYEYDIRGLLTTLHNPDGSFVQYGYNDAGQLVEESFHTGEGEARITQYERDAAGRILRREAPHGAVTHYQYNGLGQITEILLPDGITAISHTYDAAGRRTDTFYPEGQSEHWQYDAAGNVTAYTDRNGDTWAYDYNADNQPIAEHDPVSVNGGYAHPTQYHYDQMSRPTGFTDPNGNRRERRLDSMGRVVEVRDAYGEAQVLQRDAAGRVVTQTDRLGSSTHYDYNAFRELTAVTDPLDNTTRLRYDALGRRIEVEDALGQPTRWDYNYRGQVTQRTDARDHATEYSYNAFGEQTAVALPDGATTEYQRDAGGRLTAVTNAKGHRTHYQYNARDELIATTDPLGHTTRYDYDGLGRVTSIDQPEAGTDIELAYNGRDQLTERRFQGTTEQWRYDAVGRVTAIDSPASQEDYQYDPAGNLDLVTNHTLGLTIDYDYDANNRRTFMSDPKGGTGTDYERDAAGRIIAQTYNGETTTFERDALGRVTERLLPNNSRDLTLYDAVGRTRAIIQQVPSDHQYGFDDRFFSNFRTPNHSAWYDDQDDWQSTRARLANEFTENGWATEDQHLYFHDELGNLDSRLYNEKFSFFYDYDANDRLTRADEPENLTTTYQWDAVGNLAQKQVRDLVYQYDYNANDQLVQADHWRLRHSGGGNSRGKGPAYNHNGILSNWDIHQLDQQHLFEYRWDTSVNHTQERLTQRYQYDANGHPTEVDLGNGATESYQHDALGRMTQQVTEHGAQYDFKYDARDRRVHTELNDWERPYAFHSLYDQRQELGQWDEQLNPYRSLNTLPQEEQGLPYGTLISQEVHQWQNEEFRVSGFAQNYAAKAYFHQDHLGSTVKISGDDPTNTFRWDYTPMGEAYGFKHRYSNEQMTRTHVDHSPKRHLVPYLYTGKYETNLTGMVQMDARWYQPKLGRWLQPDYYNFAQLSLPNGARQQLLASTRLNTQGLLRDPAQQMRYGYVSGNPLRWVDPLGLAPQCENYNFRPIDAKPDELTNADLINEGINKIVNEPDGRIFVRTNLEANRGHYVVKEGDTVTASDGSVSARYEVVSENEVAVEVLKGGKGTKNLTITSDESGRIEVDGVPFLYRAIIPTEFE